MLIVPKLDLVFAEPPTLQYMTTPTPGAANMPGSLGIAKDTNFSVDRGYYDDPFDVVISTKQSNGTIYYTLDGRSPFNANGSLSTSAIKYTRPIHIATTKTPARGRRRRPVTSRATSTRDVHVRQRHHPSDEQPGQRPRSGRRRTWIDQETSPSSSGRAPSTR